MRILRNIKAEGIRCPVSCYPYSQDTLIVTDVDQQSPAVHFVATEEEEARKIFSFQNNHFSFKFPFVSRTGQCLSLIMRGTVSSILM